MVHTPPGVEPPRLCPVPLVTPEFVTGGGTSYTGLQEGPLLVQIREHDHIWVDYRALPFTGAFADSAATCKPTRKVFLLCSSLTQRRSKNRVTK